jgi:NTP pyrophosphatase (non-canonical NTP hydrolase)
MNLDDYSEWAETAWFSSGSNEFGERDLTIMGFGLAGETGEVMEILKKRIRDGYFDSEHLKKELGDVIYYWVRICKAFGLRPTDVLQANVDKINSRAQRGTLRGSGDDR